MSYSTTTGKRLRGVLLTAEQIAARPAVSSSVQHVRNCAADGRLARPAIQGRRGVAAKWRLADVKASERSRGLIPTRRHVARVTAGSQTDTSAV